MRTASWAGVTEKTAGKTMCCYGIPVYCTFAPNPEDTDPGRRKGYAIVKKCAGPHEKKHIPLCDCSGGTAPLDFCDHKGQSDAERASACAAADAAGQDCLNKRISDSKGLRDHGPSPPRDRPRPFPPSRRLDCSPPPHQSALSAPEEPRLRPHAAVQTHLPHRRHANAAALPLNNPRTRAPAVAVAARPLASAHRLGGPSARGS